MSVIKVSCTDQVLKILQAPVIASGGVNEVKVEFDFCEKWDGFVKTALFYQDESEIYYALLDSNDTCVIPWEVCYSDGTFYFTVLGEKGEVRRTTTTLRYKVRKGVISESMMPSNPTPEVYDQIMAAIADIKTHKILTGTTEQIKPSAVYAAMIAGTPIAIVETDPRFGVMEFTSFTHCQGTEGIVSSVIVPMDGKNYCARLQGGLFDDVWSFDSFEIADGQNSSQNDDKIPVSADLDGNTANFRNAKGAVLFTLDLSGLGVPVTYGTLVPSVDVLEIDEGAISTFAVVLGNAPSTTQEVRLTVSDETKLTINPAVLTFDSDNWNVPQTVTLTTVDNEGIGDMTAQITLSSANVDDVVIGVTIRDNEAIEWYTIQESDVEAGGYSTAHGFTGIVCKTPNVTQPNLLYPKMTVNNYTAVWSISNLATARNIKVADDATVGSFEFLFTADAPGALETISHNSKTITGVNLAYLPNLRSIPDMATSTNLNLLRINNCVNLQKLPEVNADCAVTAPQFQGNTALVDASDWVIPNKVTSMYQAFKGCTSLRKPPHIRHSVTTQWSSCFSGCPIEELYVHPDDFSKVYGTNSLLDNAFANAFTLYCNSTSEIYRQVREFVQSSSNNEERYMQRVQPINDADVINGVVFWGDSLCHFGNEDNGKMPTHFLDQMADNVMVYNLSKWGRKAVSDDAQTYFDKRAVFYGDVTVFWQGTNDITAGTDPAVLANEIQTRYIDKLTTDKYIVLNPWPNGKATAAFAEKFGIHFFDERQYIIDNWDTLPGAIGLTPTTEDNEAVAAGNIPPSLMQTDKLHLNDYSGKAISMGIKEKLLAMGYIDESWLATAE